MSQRVLVTGGCGFIGSHLVSALCERGDRVSVIDDLSSGFRDNLSGISSAAHPVELIESRLEDVRLVELGRFDAVFHLAAQASVPFSVDHFYQSSLTNVSSTLNVIEYCARQRTPLVYASSSAVYGNLPLGDERGGIDLISPYATDKLMSEMYTRMANTLYGLRSYGLRFFNVFGPRQPPDSPYSGVIAIFVGRLLRAESLVINGGYQTRDFVFVSDVVRGLLAALDYLGTHPVATYSNLLTGRSISIDQLVDTLAALTGQTPTRIYRPLPDGDPAASLGEAQRMNEQLRLGAMTSLEDGLAVTIDWMKGLNAGR